MSRKAVGALPAQGATVGQLPRHFSRTVLRWQASFGRQGLPWQNTRDPYRVWLSEIMLQQTQVATVLDYYPRFLARFPDVASLAAAEQDDVLALWSGLGYYSRARNLHRAARDVVARFGGEFPASAQALESLPGIGRSTAAAVAAFCFGERVAILDGNVKRVLTRALGFAGDMANAKEVSTLWEAATQLCPSADLATTMPRYTQAMMDLGATVCTTRQPSCLCCPLQTDCVAHAQGQPQAYPVKTKKLKRSVQSLWLLWASRGQGDVWLAQRPTPGVWAGLYCLPLFDDREALVATLSASERERAQQSPAFKHVLTHKDLYLHVVRVPAVARRAVVPQGRWFSAEEAAAVGLPAPIRRLLVG